MTHLQEIDSTKPGVAGLERRAALDPVTKPLPSLDPQAPNSRSLKGFPRGVSIPPCRPYPSSRHWHNTPMAVAIVATRNVVLSQHQHELVESLVASGQYQNASEVLRKGSANRPRMRPKSPSFVRLPTGVG